MAIIPSSIKLSIRGDDKPFQSIMLQQSMLNHNILEVTMRRDVLEDAGSKVFSESQKIIGEEIKLEVSTSDGGKATFTGIITELHSNILNSTGDTITITASSPDIMLNNALNCTSFEDVTLDGIVNKILGEYGYHGNTTVSPNNNSKFPYIIQYNENGFDFLRRLAIRFGEWFFYDGTTLNFGKLSDNTINLNSPEVLKSFDISIKTENTSFNYLTHSYAENDLISSSDQNVKIPNALNDTNSKSGNIYSHKSNQYVGNYFDDGAEQNGINDNLKLIKASAVSNMLVCHGRSENPNISLGSKVKITEKITENNSEKSIDHGTYIIYSLSHHCNQNGNYENEFTGLISDIEAPPYTNPLLYPPSEIQSAKVKDNNDPKKLGRIRVQFDWQKSDNLMTPWLRIVTPSGGDTKGFYFIPEIDEEVLVGFEGGNGERPYVIGSLYNEKVNADGKWITPSNDFKAIRTRGGFTFEINDTDGGEEVKIYDNKNQNYSILLSSHGKDINIVSQGTIEITATDDLTIKAKNIRMTADQKIEIKATDIEETADNKIKIKATDIDEKADMSLKISCTEGKIEADASLSIDGGGMLDEDGGVITLN